MTEVLHSYSRCSTLDLPVENLETFPNKIKRIDLNTREKLRNRIYFGITQSHAQITTVQRFGQRVTRFVCLAYRCLKLMSLGGLREDSLTPAYVYMLGRSASVLLMTSFSSASRSVWRAPGVEDSDWHEFFCKY